MKITLVLLALLSLTFSQTWLQIPEDYSSSFTFHYKGNVYAILDVLNSNATASPRLAMISNAQWSNTFDLPYKCLEFPCSTSTNDFTILNNVLYVDLGSLLDPQRVIATINLDTLTVTESIQTPADVQIDGAQFIPMSESSMIYMYSERAFIPYFFLVKLTLPSLAWQLIDLEYQLNRVSTAVSIDENTLIVCDSYNCDNIDINTAFVTTLNSVPPYGYGNFIPSTKTLLCNDFIWTDNATVVQTYSIQSESVDFIQNTTVGGLSEYPAASFVNEALGVAYVITVVYENDQVSQYYLTTFNVNTLQQLSRVTLSLNGYEINRYYQTISSEGDGILALPLRASVEKPGPYQILLLAV